MSGPYCTGVAASWCPVCGDCACRDAEGELVCDGLNNPACPLHRPSSTHAEACWLILCLDEPGHGGVGLWWKPGAAGYTRDLDKAGRWTEEDARTLAGRRDGGDMAMRLPDVEGHAHRVVDLDRIADAWKAIQARRRRA